MRIFQLAAASKRSPGLSTKVWMLTTKKLCNEDPAFSTRDAAADYDTVTTRDSRWE